MLAAEASRMRTAALLTTMLAAPGVACGADRDGDGASRTEAGGPGGGSRSPGGAGHVERHPAGSDVGVDTTLGFTDCGLRAVE
jgi:hypothetical protein